MWLILVWMFGLSGRRRARTAILGLSAFYLGLLIKGIYQLRELSLSDLTHELR
jgi:hypothetical protein